LKDMAMGKNFWQTLYVSALTEGAHAGRPLQYKWALLDCDLV